MKRFLAIAAAFLLIFSVQANAQIRYGITGGINFNTSEISGIDVDTKAGWNLGVTALVDLPLGFSIQPSLVYSQKGANLVSMDGFTASQSMGFLELPVSVQWGPDLLLFRPFVDVTPFVGYALNNKFVANLNIPRSGLSASANVNESLPWNNLERFEYGVGIGGGINVWKLQVIARYCWNLGSLYDVDGWDDIKDQISGLSRESKNFGGVHVGVSLFF